MLRFASGILHSGHWLLCCCNHFGPVHQIEDDNSEGDKPLVAMSAGLSLVGTYLKHMPSCAFISFNRLVINAGNGFAVCIQCSTHWESVHIGPSKSQVNEAPSLPI